MLGICGSSVEECIGCLKSWVTNLDLSRGLLHGADVAGVSIDTATFRRAFVKYKGAMSWKEWERIRCPMDTWRCYARRL